MNRSSQHARCFIAVLVLALTATMITPAWSAPKDRDGSRLKAKSMALGKTVKDRLEAPGDVSDWRYIPVKSDGKLTLILQFTPTTAPVTLRLLTAHGEVVQSAKGNSTGRLTVSKTLKAGIYYLEVKIGAGAVSYSVQGRFK